MEGTRVEELSNEATRKVTCPCGKGKVSKYDGKCGHCRTKAEAERRRRDLGY